MSTRNEILAAAVAEFRQNDEANFRMTAVARQAGCSTSVLYHYFGSREGLIDAALVGIITDEILELGDFVRAASEAADSADDAIELLVNYAAVAHAPERRAFRSMRARLLSAAQSRPAVRDAFLEFSELVANANRAMISTLQGKGLMRRDLDVESILLLLRGLDYGWFADDLYESSRVDFDRWLGFVRELATVLTLTPAYLV